MKLKVKCPYCGNLHDDVNPGAYSWGCRFCGNSFIVPLLAKMFPNKIVEGEKEKK